MSNSEIPFSFIDWDTIPKEQYPGEAGTATWQTVELGGLRIRMVEYSADYVADHWCQKGHIVHCLEGEFTTQQENGEPLVLCRGMTYVVSDGMSSHRSVTENGAQLLIVDGAFLA